MKQKIIIEVTVHSDDDIAIDEEAVADSTAQLFEDMTGAEIIVNVTTQEDEE